MEIASNHEGEVCFHIELSSKSAIFYFFFLKPENVKNKWTTFWGQAVALWISENIEVNFLGGEGDISQGELHVT